MEKTEKIEKQVIQEKKETIQDKQKIIQKKLENQNKEKVENIMENKINIKNTNFTSQKMQNKDELNKMTLKVKALSINESFVRASVSGFCLQLNPSLDELTDIKTAVSEAVTNCIVHAYPNESGEITINVTLYNDSVKIEIIDNGIGIKNLEEAKKPFFTTKPNEERSGMGFTVMESFMDSVQVLNNLAGGVKVELTKNISLCHSERVINLNT